MFLMKCEYHYVQEDATTTTIHNIPYNTHIHPSHNITIIRHLTSTHPPPTNINPPPTSITTWNTQAGFGKQYLHNPIFAKHKHQTLITTVQNSDITTLQETHSQPHDIIAFNNDLHDEYNITSSLGQPHTHGQHSCQIISLSLVWCIWRMY